MRKRTGLRNKWRTSTSTYHLKGKGKNSDHYGQRADGRITDRVAGRTITYRVGREDIHQ